jgi:DNA repair exonuclease SbcCD ATPase subunit
MDQYDANLLQLRLENKRQVEELDKEIKKREEEANKVRRVEVKALDTSVQELRKELDILPRLEKGIQARVEEDTRLVRSVDEVRARLESVRRDEDEYTRTYRLLEDGRRQDAKRLTDLQGDVAVLRKQADSQRGQTEVLNTGVRKLETRMNELVTVEVERREVMQTFLDKQALAQVERDRVWKDWQTRFETIEKQAADTEKQLVSLEATHREAKRTQLVLEELNQRVERRINEITEVQRLGEDRFRQEWVTFKADDQKRWTSYTLTQEEQRSESHRQFDHMAEQVTQLGDSLQEARDLLQQGNELTEKRLQSLLATVHEWVTSFERTIGRTR